MTANNNESEKFEKSIENNLNGTSGANSPDMTGGDFCVEKNKEKSGEKGNQDSESEILLENYDKNSDDVTASFIDPPEEKIYKKPQKITVQTLFLSALTLKKRSDENELVKKMRPVNTVWLLVLIAVSAGLMLLAFDFVDGKMFLPVLVSFCAISFPAALMTLNYELCAEKNVSILQIFVAFCMGVLAYALINALAGGLLVKFVYQTIVDAVFVPVLWGIAELLALLLVIRIYNITDLQSCILLAVCIGMGFCFTKSIFDLFSSLFLQVEVTAQGGVKYIGYGILDDAEFFKKSVTALSAKIPLDCIYYPFMFASWSVAIGNVASLYGALKDKKKQAPFSVYLLLILVIALYMLCEFKASLGGFDVALKIFCGGVSLFVAVRQLNACIEKAAGNVK